VPLSVTVNVGGISRPPGILGVNAALTFTLTATGFGGQKNPSGGRQTATVQVFPMPSRPQIVSFNGTPPNANGGYTTILAGTAVTYSWQVLSVPGITNVSLDGYVSGKGQVFYQTNLPLKGSLTVSPRENTQYTLTAWTYPPSPLGSAVVGTWVSSNLASSQCPQEEAVTRVSSASSPTRS
jgi:hypothetical protein